MFVDTRQALDEAIRLLRGNREIESALLAGLDSGEPIAADANLGASEQKEILRIYQARQK
jgi:hypothetical protein